MSSSIQPTPSMRAPAGLPPSGNSKYIVIVILLVIAIAGLVMFRMHGDSGPTVTVRPASTFDAAPISHTRRTTSPCRRSPKSPSSGKRGRPLGKSSSIRVSRRRVRERRLKSWSSRWPIARRPHSACYDQALAQDSYDLKGHISLKVRVGSNGTVCAANVTGNGMGTDSVATCVANTFRSFEGLPGAQGELRRDQRAGISFVPGGK